MILQKTTSFVKKHSYYILVFLIFYLTLIFVSMIPAWMAACIVEEKIEKYYLSVFEAIEKSCNSIACLEKELMFYNKLKFIESNGQPHKNTVAYLAANKNTYKNIKEISIARLGPAKNNKAIISKATNLDPLWKINFLTHENEILNNVINDNLRPFFKFRTNEENINFLTMVWPSHLLLRILGVAAFLLTITYTTLQKFVYNKKLLSKKLLEFEATNNFKTSKMEVLSFSLTELYDDLNQIFLTTDLDAKNISTSQTHKLLNDIRQSLGRILTFRTFKREDSEVELVRDINIALDCCLEQIIDKKINVVRTNFNPAVFVNQTKIKNMLIISSVINLFVSNMPPKSQLTICIDNDTAGNVKVTFCDNMPLPWKSFAPQELKNINQYNIFLSLDNLIYACADENIKVDRGSLPVGNYFSLEYHLGKTEHAINVIKGNFR